MIYSNQVCQGVLHDQCMTLACLTMAARSMRSMVARMIGGDDPTEGKAPTLDPLKD